MFSEELLLKSICNFFIVFEFFTDQFFWSQQFLYLLDLHEIRLGKRVERYLFIRR